jgi:alkylated DNA repair dioxygenase AlkB
MKIMEDVSYWNGVFSEEESLMHFDHLSTLPSLAQGSFHLFGKPVKTPRLESFHGISPIPYRYSGQTLHSMPFTAPMHDILARITELTGCTFNAVLINVYRNGMDSNGWHADNEKELGKNPIIASVSFGAERKFQLKSRDGALKKTIPLENGSLLLMGGSIQQDFIHCIPKEPKVVLPRINLTFRTVFEVR